MPEDDGGALAFSHFHVLDRLGIAFVWRGQGAPQEVATAGGQQRCEEKNREQRLKIFAAAAAPCPAAGYDRLRCSSRYDCRITAAAAMSMSRSASRRFRPPERSLSAASTVVSASSQSTTSLQVLCRRRSAKSWNFVSPRSRNCRRGIPTTIVSASSCRARSASVATTSPSLGTTE